MTPESKTSFFIVSACLAGCACRYDGRDQARPEIRALVQTGQALVVCPEVLGGLPTPRTPCERLGPVVLNKKGEDCTSAYYRGAQVALEEIKKALLQKETQSLAPTDSDNKEKVTAYLKSKSPMCGYGLIYDGHFSGRFIAGNGVFTELLIAEGGIDIIAVD